MDQLTRDTLFRAVFVVPFAVWFARREWKNWRAWKVVRNLRPEGRPPSRGVGGVTSRRRSTVAMEGPPARSGHPRGHRGICFSIAVPGGVGRFGRPWGSRRHQLLPVWVGVGAGTAGRS